MKRSIIIASCLIGFTQGPANAGSLVLNTGYNHGATTPGLYPIAARDDYWIKIASYEPPATGNTTVPVERAWVAATGWISVPNALRISPRSSVTSSAGTSTSRRAYSLFRKCFCLLDTQNAQMSFSLRADDYVQVWLNGITNTLVGPTLGNYVNTSPVLTYSSAQNPASARYFEVGRNCLYVFLEDVSTPTTGGISFALSGTVSAPGLMPMPAIGEQGNFGPCGCPTEPNSAQASAADSQASTVRAIVRFAEARQQRSAELDLRVRAYAGSREQNQGGSGAQVSPGSGGR